MNEKKGLLIVGHGSRSQKAIDQFKNASAKITKKLPHHITETAFLEFAKPTIDEKFQALADQKLKEITIMPLMLMGAGHIKNDIPSEVNHLQQHFPQINIRYGKPIDVHAKALKAAKEIIIEAYQNNQPKLPLEQSFLLVIGRGASDSDANSNIAKITHMLWEGLKIKFAQTAFSSNAYPITCDALNQLHPLGFKQIIVFPYFLFCGQLIDKIHHECDTYQQKHPEVKLIKAPYFNDHPLIIESFLERLEEVENGNGNMNCKLCHYREQIIGFEHKQGEPQTGHHHHVRGIGVTHKH